MRAITGRLVTGAQIWYSIKREGLFVCSVSTRFFQMSPTGGDRADSDPLIRVFVLARIVCFKITWHACKDLESGFPHGLWRESSCLAALCGRGGANAGIYSISCAICLKPRGVCSFRLLSCVSERQTQSCHFPEQRWKPLTPRSVNSILRFGLSFPKWFLSGLDSFILCVWVFSLHARLTLTCICTHTSHICAWSTVVRRRFWTSWK